MQLVNQIGKSVEFLDYIYAISKDDYESAIKQLKKKTFFKRFSVD